MAQLRHYPFGFSLLMGFAFFRPAFFNAVSIRNSIWPFTLRNSSTDHFSRALYTSSSILNTNVFLSATPLIDYEYNEPVFNTGWAPLSPQSTTIRLLTIAALRSSSSSTIFFLLNCSSASSTIPTAPSTIL